MNDEKKTKFLRIYANLPQGTREEIIAVVNGEPYTWQSARIEIDGADTPTPVGAEILDVLTKLGIL
jgi:hypothetical protein